MFNGGENCPIPWQNSTSKTTTNSQGQNFPYIPLRNTESFRLKKTSKVIKSNHDLTLSCPVVSVATKGQQGELPAHAAWCNTPRKSLVTSEQYEAGSANMSDLSPAELAQVCLNCVPGATHTRQKQLSSVAAPRPKATHRCFCTGDSYSNKSSHIGSLEVTLFLA